MNNLFTNLPKRHLIFLLACCIFPWFLPALAQHADYHNFADTRTLLGLHNFMNVLSNVGFALAGLSCAWITHKNKHVLGSGLYHALCAVGVGSILTAAGSGYYHLNPNNVTLVWDRLPMTLTFAGLLSVMAFQLTQHRPFTNHVLISGIIYGISSVGYWAFSENLTPYIVLQFGGLLWLLINTYHFKHTHLLNWSALLGFYVLAKIAETYDSAIFELCQHLISGHSLKHVLASIGLAIVVYSLHLTIKHNTTKPT